MPTKKFVVLLVEDEPTAQEIAKIQLIPHAEVIIAGSVNRAMHSVRERDDITHAILDGRVPVFDGETLRPSDTTVDLAYHISEFHTRIKAFSASADDELNRGLTEAGCILASKVTAVGMVVGDIQQNQSK